MLATDTEVHPPKVGDGASVQMWSDRKAGTVIAVSPTGHEVTWQEDHAKRTDSNGMSECQDYDYSPNPDGIVRVFTRRKLPGGGVGYVAKGQGRKDGSYLKPGRRAYHDYSF